MNGNYGRRLRVPSRSGHTKIRTPFNRLLTNYWWPEVRNSTIRRDLESAVTALKRHGRVVIVGGPKSGKTFLAHTLLHQFSTRFTNHIICNARSLNKQLHEGRPRILLMDGTLGEVGVDMEEYKVWRALLPRLMTCTDVRHCLVVVTCYPHVLLELQALEEGSHSFLLQDTCTVSLKEMAEDERKEMLHDFLSDLTMTQQEKHALVERVLKDDISGATFPWCCARLVQRLHNSSLDDPSDVFTAPAESYVTLLHRMLMDPTHGETLAVLLCLAMMGLSDFYGNQHNTHTTLTELGFQEFSVYTLEKNVVLLRNFILSEDGSTFFSRVLYDAAGLALGRSHLLPVLLKICDMDFLVKYVRMFVESSKLFLVIPLNSLNSKHLMERILTDIEKGKLFEISQYLSLQSELFLENLEKYNHTRKSGKIQLARAVDTVHGLSLLYWSAWSGCDWLVNWCLDISFKDDIIPLCLLQSAFIWALLNRSACSEDKNCNICHISYNLKTKDISQGSATLTLPVPVETLFLSKQSKAVSSLATSCTDLTYLSDPSLPIPPSALLIDRTGESCHQGFSSKQLYVALRLLCDTQVNQLDDEGNTLLHVAAEAGGEDVVEVVVKSGASLTARNNSNLTPPQVAQRRDTGENTNSYYGDRKNIHKACEEGHMVTVKVLLCCGVSLEVKDSDNRTPLHAACHGGHTDLVRLLLELGSNVNAEDNNGSTALHVACGKGFKDIALILIEHGAEIYGSHTSLDTPLNLACSKSKKQCVSVLLDRGADINFMAQNGKTPLHCACEYGRTDIAVVLVDRGADINVVNDYHETPLHCACVFGRTDIAALLLERGADINGRNCSGDTPLHCACAFGRTQTATLLLMRGADINVMNDAGDTPLFYAFGRGRKNIAALLLEHGADINVRNYSGITPSEWAQACGHTKIVRLLLQWSGSGDVSPEDKETKWIST